MKSPEQMQIYLKRWHPSSYTVDPPHEIILDQNSPAHLRMRIAEASEIPPVREWCALFRILYRCALFRETATFCVQLSYFMSEPQRNRIKCDCNPIRRSMSCSGRLTTRSRERSLFWIWRRSWNGTQTSPPSAPCPCQFTMTDLFSTISEWALIRKE